MSLRSCGLRGMIGGVRTEKTKRYSRERYGMQTGNAATFVPVIPAERAGLRPASESRNPVTKAVRALTPAVDYWVPAPPAPGEPGRAWAVGADGSYRRALPCVGAVLNPAPTCGDFDRTPSSYESRLGRSSDGRKVLGMACISSGTPFQP